MIYFICIAFSLLPIFQLPAMEDPRLSAKPPISSAQKNELISSLIDIYAAEKEQGLPIIDDVLKQWSFANGPTEKIHTINNFLELLEEAYQISAKPLITIICSALKNYYQHNFNKADGDTEAIAFYIQERTSQLYSQLLSINPHDNYCELCDLVKLKPQEMHPYVYHAINTALKQPSKPRPVFKVPLNIQLYNGKETFIIKRCPTIEVVRSATLFAANHEHLFVLAPELFQLYFYNLHTGASIDSYYVELAEQPLCFIKNNINNITCNELSISLCNPTSEEPLYLLSSSCLCKPSIVTKQYVAAINKKDNRTTMAIFDRKNQEYVKLTSDIPAIVSLHALTAHKLISRSDVGMIHCWNLKKRTHKLISKYNDGIGQIIINENKIFSLHNNRVIKFNDISKKSALPIYNEKFGHIVSDIICYKQCLVAAIGNNLKIWPTAHTISASSAQTIYLDSTKPITKLHVFDDFLIAQNANNTLYVFQAIQKK